MCGACSAWISRTAATAVATSGLDAPAVLRGSRDATALDGIPERVGRRLGGPERQPLRLEVRVLDGEVQDAAIERLVLGEPGDELLQEAGFVLVPGILKQRFQGVEVLPDGLFRHVGLARIRDRLGIALRHDRPVGGIGGAGELGEQITGEVASLRQLRQGAFTFTSRHPAARMTARTTDAEEACCAARPV